jgi:flagellar assembly protein FliH
MSKKIIGKNKQKNLKEMNIASFGDVERGEKPFGLQILKETNIVHGELPYHFASFDNIVTLGHARIIGETSLTASVEEPEEEQEAEPAETLGFSEEIFKEEEPQEPRIDEEKLKELLKAEYDRAFDEGKAKGLAEGLAQNRQAYEKEKKDYLSMLNSCYTDVLSKANAFDAAVSELDSALPELLTFFLEDIIGVERAVNSALVVSVAKRSLNNLHELSKVVFKVNPADADILREAFPDTEVKADNDITKGGLKIDTNIGEMDYTIETMVENFKKLIYEELESS